MQLADAAANPTADGEIQRYGEDIKAYLEQAVQKFVLQRYPGVNPGINQLCNPSFEVDTDATKPPTGWLEANDGGEADDAKAYDGSFSALITNTGSNNALRQLITMQKGQYACFSVAVWASESNKAGLRINFDDVWYETYHSGSSDWEILSLVLGPITQASDVVTYQLELDSTASAPAWFDQAVMEVFDSAKLIIGGGTKHEQIEIDDGDSPYTITESSPDIIFADSTAAAITVNMPTLADNQRRKITIKNTGTGGNNVTTDGEGAETIDGSATQTIADYECLVVRAQSVEWSVT